MDILHITAECFPIAKVGGLADVLGALPKYLTGENCPASVIMPYYENQFTEKHEKALTVDFEGDVIVGHLNFNFEILRLQSLEEFPIYLVKIPNLLDRPQVYGYEDDTERFFTFQLVVLKWLLQFDKLPKAIHCHDHHTGLIPFMMTHCHMFEDLSKTPTIFTIHNAQYQGQFSFDKLYYFPPFDLNYSGLLEWDNQINPLAAAIKCAWKVTTVSKTYMKELKQTAKGLEWLFDNEKEKSTGILNGIDHSVWNPKTDEMIPFQFAHNNLIKGKANNKKALCEYFNLNSEKPTFSFIGRLVYEKGADILTEMLDKILQYTEFSCNLIVLGSGDTTTSEKLKKIALKHPNNIGVFIGYDESLSHLIYAGSDFLLMPSRVEPCGLNQMYAMRYGTIPIVHAVGGLKDTVKDVEEEGFGFVINKLEPENVGLTCQRAVEMFKDKETFNKARKEVFAIDHSWENAAKNYINIYENL